MILSLPLALALPGAAAIGQEAPPAAGADGFPEDFQGTVHYFGNNNGTVAVIGAAPAKKSDTCPRPDGGCPKPIGGSLDVELEFQDAVVRGRYHGTGGLRDGELIGRRTGGMCRLFDKSDGSVWSGRCDRESFVGRVKSVANAATQLDLSFEALGTDIVDFAERDRLNERIARIAYLTPIARGNGEIAARLAAIAELEGYSSKLYEFAPETLGRIDLSRKADGGRTFVAHAPFSTVDGRNGWIRAQIERDVLMCVETSFAPGDCHPLMPPVLSGDTGS